MPPTTTPLPTPTATQTVVLQLPPDVLQKLTPDAGPVSQPTATMVAAGFAVLAAAIALIGVWWQIKRADERAGKDRSAAADAARLAAEAADARARADRAASSEAQREMLENQAKIRVEDRLAARAEARHNEKRDALMELSRAVGRARIAGWDVTIYENGDSGVEKMAVAIDAVRQADLAIATVTYLGCSRVAISAGRIVKLTREIAAMARDYDDGQEDELKAARKAHDDKINDEMSRLHTLVLDEIADEKSGS